MKDILCKKLLWGVIGTVIIVAIAISIFLKVNSMPKVEGSTVIIPVNKDKLTVQVCADNILQVHYLPDGKSTPNTEVVGTTNWSPVEASIDIKSDPMVIKTNSMVVEINKKTDKISVFDSKNNLLLKEQDAVSLSDGSIKFNHQDGQNFYGIGAYTANDSPKGLLRKNLSEVTAGKQGYAGGPLVWSTSGYGLLVDSDGGSFDIGNDNLNFTESSKKDVNYFVMVGEPKNIMTSISQISGKSPMFPKWAMGFTNSEWGIDQKELTSIVDTYREKQIPIDNYTLDFDWKAWGQDNYGEFRWNTDKFPDGASGKLSSMMADKGVKLTGIMKPRIHVDTEEGKYADEHKLWLEDKGPSVDYFSKKMVEDIDFSKSEARTWYFEHAKQALDSGLVGWWNDEADESSPNLQFLNMQKALYEGQRSSTNMRVWSINRNFYLGAQKYGYGMWSGDVNTGFYSMAGQRDRMLSSIVLGENKWGMDTGGFNGGNPNPENYARWMEFSAFVPIFRVHGNLNQQRQPWVFGTTAEAAATKAIRLRYSLIPYIYTYDRQAYDNGIGLVRPLIFDYPDDKKVADDVDSWMFGDYMLVSPVVKQGETEKDIYLPKGDWIDYFNGTKYDGGQTIKYTVNNQTWDDIPLFVKKGAIIPSNSKPIQHVEEKVDTLNLDVFPGKDKTSFKYYDDDGKTYNYENGEYFIQNMETQDNGNSIEFKIDNKTGSYTPDTQYYVIKIHGNAGKEVKVNGESIKAASSIDDMANSPNEARINSKDVYGDATYIKVKAGEEKAIEILK
ncbi:TIM-barrel domain-containing protein [Clostridium sp.]|uniref:glycoside hydrolase family 31 protein n=1 Tax=Clostridium sp. TaxID=1506 RepID=UPI00283F94AA|nr:TIM-barrel domain-containing protein [Clostridium sp.]MDR3597551.1 glycoside hydrolase family 31 protein [Clostridium sp.]